MKNSFVYVFLIVAASFLHIAYADGFASNTSNNFLIITDVHVDHSSNHVMEIDPSIQTKLNDLDEPSFKKLVAEVEHQIKAGLIAQPKFILLLGDLVGHIRTSPESAPESENDVFKLLHSTFPSTPILYTFGNNDSLKINYGPFFDPNGNTVEHSPYDVAIHRGQWRDGFLSTGIQCDNTTNTFPCLITEDKVNGYYSAYVEPKLRLIAVNSVMFSPRRSGITAQDVKNQLQWLNDQLAQVKNANEVALITMHVSPGNNVFDHSNFWVAEDNQAFLQVISAYQNNIIGLLAAHTHTDELKVIKNAAGDILTGVYLSPALSTSHGNAPAVRTFYYEENKGRWAISNYETYAFSDRNNSFQKLYNYQHYYCQFPTHDLTRCLDQVNADKMAKYFTAGNVNYAGVIDFPNDIFISVSETP